MRIDTGVPVLRLSGVGKRYGPGRWVLTGVDLEIFPGETVAVTGANGSGKSTLLRILAGVSRPSRGSVTGRPPVVGYVPERFPPTDRLPAHAYLVHMGRIRGLRTPEASVRTDRWLDRLALAGEARAPIRSLSKGNAQKVALAQALLVPPDLLVLDEPWSGLDVAAHDILAEVIGEVAGAGGSVVFTDHRESVTRTRAGRRYAVRDGRVSVAVAGPDPAGTARVVLAAPGGPGPGEDVGWAALDGVAGVTPAGRSVVVRVADPACDALLGRALRHGWSVREVSRCAP